MNDNEKEVKIGEAVPFVVFESIQALHEKALERENEKFKFVVGWLIAVILVLCVAVGYFAYDYFSFERISYVQDGQGQNLILGNNNSGVEQNGTTAKNDIKE